MKTPKLITIAKVNRQITGNMGLYYVCFELSKRQWNVMPTARNARGVDLIAYDQSASRIFGIQVKALSKKYAVPLGPSLDKIMGDFWIVVNNLSTTPQAFILKPAEVRKLAVRDKNKGKVYWLPEVKYANERFLNTWERIGSGNGSK